ncbi:hypothetical protein FGO68_gene10402 [Halteria grandinella]|uniref:Uncharacterized protein n=1 Tax=Halteria grandinella TaxID=5974 RepID=A0A8J8N906_HALGN|nr:hypothetical protein FGO68_gene10402 [Halteria grandinella]
MVQPSEVIEPQPKATPPSNAVPEFVTVRRDGLKRPPANAAANEDPIMPMTSQPLFVSVSVTTAIQPAMRSRPVRVSGPIPFEFIKVRAVVLN